MPARRASAAVTPHSAGTPVIGEIMQTRPSLFRRPLGQGAAPRLFEKLRVLSLTTDDRELFGHDWISHPRRSLQSVSSPMSDTPLTGAQKSKLRALGQQLDATLKVGKEGLTPAFFTELTRALRANELVKLRFVGDADRDARATLCERIATEGHCACVGAVGHTALFHRPHAARTPSHPVQP